MIIILNLQKAGLVKRASAFLFDVIIFCVVAVAAALLISAIVGYDAKLDDLENSYLIYEDKYNIDLDITAEQYEKLSDAEKAIYEQASKEFANDAAAQKLQMVIFSLTLVIISLSCLFAFLLLELLIPFIFKNGQTFGKKIFGIALMRTDGVKASGFQVFVRAILGKYTIETMVPVLLLLLFLMGATGFLGLLVIIALLILQIAVMIITDTNSLIHDLLAVTAVVDFNTQMIFENREQLIEYQKKKALEAAEQSGN